MKHRISVTVTSETETVSKTYRFDTSVEVAAFMYGLRVANNPNLTFGEITETHIRPKPKEN